MLGFLAAGALAQDCSTRYVSSSTGSDSNSGCAFTSPLLTIRQCILLVGSSGTCYVLPGTYHEPGDGTHVDENGVTAGTFFEDVEGLTIELAPEWAWAVAEEDGGETTATIDGTVELAGWQELSDAHGTYYRSTNAYADTVWQLFADGMPLTPARWPNALLWTEDWWDREVGWARQAEGTSCGSNVDAGTTSPAAGEEGHQSLAATGVSFDGCNMIVNNEHWKMRRYTVANHTAGTGNFTYAHQDATDNPLCAKYGDDLDMNAYFIDGCVAAFDVAGEWAADADGHLLLRLPAEQAGTPIEQISLRGKVQTYAFAFGGCHFLTVRNLHFFATTLLAYDTADVTYASNVWRYPSASRRALGSAVREFNAKSAYGLANAAANQGVNPIDEEYEIEVPSTWVGCRSWIGLSTRLHFDDNEVFYAEGSALACAYCTNDTVENNLVSHAGYPFARAFQFGGTQTHYVTLRRNSIEWDGSGAIAWLWGDGNVAEYNRIRKSGLLIIDNEGIQGGKPTSRASFRFNWVHDSRGLGLRFDAGEDGNFGVSNNLQFNVCFRNLQGGLSGKSNNASNYRNTAIDNQGGADIEAGTFGEAADFKVCACYPSTCVGERDGTRRAGVQWWPLSATRTPHPPRGWPPPPAGSCPHGCSVHAHAGEEVDAFTNIGSVTRGNVGIMEPGTVGGLNKPYDIPGEHTHNLNLATATHGASAERERRNLFRDYDNYDFRPHPEGPLVDAGVEHGIAGMAIDGAPATVGEAPDIGAYEHGSPTYWIPGRQYAHASAPVPPTGATKVLPSADLMFLPGKSAASHVVYQAVVSSAASRRRRRSLRRLSESVVDGDGDDAYVLAYAATLEGDANVYTPSAPLVPGTTHAWRVDAVGADGTVETGQEWTFTVGCEDYGCEDCGEATAEAACMACEEGQQLMIGLSNSGSPVGRCTEAGGCLDGRWDLNATSTVYQGPARYCDQDTWLCAFGDHAGVHTDVFEVVSVANANCASYRAGQGQAVLVHNGVQLYGLSCDNNAYVVSAAFSCASCEAGFVRDASSLSGCRVDTEPLGFNPCQCVEVEGVRRCICTPSDAMVTQHEALRRAARLYRSVAVDAAGGVVEA